MDLAYDPTTPTTESRVTLMNQVGSDQTPAKRRCDELTDGYMGCDEDSDDSEDLDSIALG